MSLAGRSRELDRLLSVIRGPKDTALAVSGAHGIGKSALVSEIPHLTDYRTVFLGASVFESAWPMSGLTALLNALDDPVLNGIGDQILRDAAGTLDPPAISALLLRGLHQRSSSRTVIVVDDADQLDPSSQAVIGFLARRLAGTDMALILCIREEIPESPFSGLPVLQLQPLSYSETVQMLEALPVRHAAQAAIHAVAGASRGNPLAAVELYNQLLERHAEGKFALPVPLAAKCSFEAEFALAVGGLTEVARNVLNLLSLSFRSDISAIERINPDVWSGVEELLGVGLVRRTGSFVGIRDQLLRGYIFASMTPAVRTAYHGALAKASETADPHARKWHLSFTALERQTPFGLLRQAADLIRAGEVRFAFEYVERALSINPWEAEIAARLSTVAELLINRGEFVYASRYVEWAQRITRNPALILRLTGLSFEIEFIQGAAIRSAMVLRLVKEFGQYDPSFAARLLAVAAVYYAERWELSDAREILSYASKFEDSASEECRGITERAKVLAESVGGDAESANPKHTPGGDSTIAGLLIHGRALSYAERHSEAQEIFARVRSSAADADCNWRETALFLSADNEIRAGNVRTAVKLIDELEQRVPGSTYHRGMRLVFRTWRAHALGDEPMARSYAKEAQRHAGVESHAATTAQLASWQGHFALLRGDLAESLAQLSRAAEIGSRFTNPTLLRCDADLIEVLVRLGRHQEATQVLASLESRSVGLRSPWLMAALARSRAILADGEQSLQLFAQALEGRNRHESLLERARTMLCYAERLKALGRTRDARDEMMRAKVIFDEIGANAWLQKVDSLLLNERVEAPGPQGNPAMLLLADHERVLSTMVARGMRNKEIAATLFVSVRTVEVRLTAIYRKLGVESRAQLTALAAGKANSLPEPYVLPVL